MRRIVVFDEAGWAADRVEQSLADEDLVVRRVADRKEASRSLREGPDLLVLNLCLQPSAEFTPLEELAREAADVPLLVLTGCAPLEAAARLLFPQAVDIVRFPAPGLGPRLVKALRNGEGRSPRAPDLRGVVGSSKAMQAVYRKSLEAARSDATILITGETGTGKGLLARAIHELSDRKDRPFVVVNCAELTESLVESELFGHVRGSFTGATRDKVGLFEAADGGTVLLDEVAEASPTVQARLLRIVEDKESRRIGEVSTRPVDARLIVTTHVDLEERIEAGRFRKDLFFRLRILTLTLPPLRDRLADIPELVEHFLSGFSKRRDGVWRCSPLVVEVLRSHTWPGNVRELFAVLEAAATTAEGTTVKASDLRTELLSAWSDGAGEDSDEVLIRRALQEADGHRGRTAEILGISRTTLWRRLKELEVPGHSPGA